MSRLADRFMRHLGGLADARRSEGGYITILLAMLVASGFLMTALAVSIDTSRWYDEMNRIQKAADAAALAGVPYLPYEFDNAKTRALDVAKRNGYDDASADVEVKVTKGDIPSQLKVTISARIDNTFGGFIGHSRTWLYRSATADYKGKAPMGSPCNTFANEPPAGTPNAKTTATGSALGSPVLSGCTSKPQFWATLQGPETDKQWGDRYQSWACAASTTENCASGKNSEYSDPGYFWVVRVAEAAKNHPITIQLYDPAYVSSGTSCASLPAGTGFTANPNPYVTVGDGKARYGKENVVSTTGSTFCTADHESGTAINHAVTTSFVMRGTTSSGDPIQAPIISTNCIKQYVGQTAVPTATQLTIGNSNYNDNLSQIFHNWTNLCTFTPTAAGDYYLQVRNNVPAAGTASTTQTNSKPVLIYTGNPKAAEASPSTLTHTGSGDNSFAIRALTDTGLQASVAVSGYDRMPIYQSAIGSTATFNLIRVLPAAAGNYIEFSFYDAADCSSCSSGGSIKVGVPAKATGSITTVPFPNGGCTAIGGYAGAGATYSNCTAPVTNSMNNAKVEKITIPVPSDYNCVIANPDECWYTVTVTFPSGSDVSDITTWDATIVGDPVRLIK